MTIVVSTQEEIRVIIQKLTPFRIVYHNGTTTIDNNLRIIRSLDCVNSLKKRVGFAALLAIVAFSCSLTASFFLSKNYSLFKRINLTLLTPLTTTALLILALLSERIREKIFVKEKSVKIAIDQKMPFCINEGLSFLPKNLKIIGSVATCSDHPNAILFKEKPDIPCFSVQKGKDKPSIVLSLMTEKTQPLSDLFQLLDEDEAKIVCETIITETHYHSTALSELNRKAFLEKCSQLKVALTQDFVTFIHTEWSNLKEWTGEISSLIEILLPIMSTQSLTIKLTVFIVKFFEQPIEDKLKQMFKDLIDHETKQTLSQNFRDKHLIEAPPPK